jgi:general secretion pathway protein G
MNYGSMRISQSGITLIEVVLVTGIIGVLTAIALPSYQQYIERAEVDTALVDIEMIQQKIVRYIASGNALPPANLNAIGLGNKKDPWGNNYEYLRFFGINGNGSFRKNRNMVPINTDYDLYSKGKNSDSKLPIVNPVSQDDIIRARNGNFIGLASDF